MGRQRKSIMDKAIEAMRSGPAPKEERMQAEFQTCPRCKKEQQWGGHVEKGAHAVMDEPCYDCEQEIDEWQTTARAVYREAYMAVLGGGFGQIASHKDALETVRNWPAMMAELEEVINEPTR